MNRREFLKGAAVAGAGMATAGVLGGWSPAPAPIPTKWDEEADVVVIGAGGGGLATAITAIDTGAKVVVLEKYKADDGKTVNWTPSSRWPGGILFCPKTLDGATAYMEAMVTLGGETLDAKRKELVDKFAKYIIEGKDWLEKMGGQKMMESNTVEFPELPGSKDVMVYVVTPYTDENGIKYSGGPAYFKSLINAATKRNVAIRWETPARKLIQNPDTREILGVIATKGGSDYFVKAKKAVVLATGGFEYNDEMKQNYGRAFPTNFYGSPNSTGDGIKMALDVGANLWHMNCYSARITAKWPDFPVAFTLSIGGQGGEILVDRFGKRFAQIPYRGHSFFYELIDFDTHQEIYHKIPCYYVFDQKRMKTKIQSTAGSVGPIHELGEGPNLYEWSADNSKELAAGYILKADTLTALAGLIKDKFGEQYMDAPTLEAEIKKFNDICAKGVDADFGQAKTALIPLDTPPFYAIKMAPGGPNTQGGPKRDLNARVLDPWDQPIPRLYSAGELGSWWGMLYNGGGNLAECIVSGRVAGENAANEKAWG